MQQNRQRTLERSHRNQMPGSKFGTRSSAGGSARTETAARRSTGSSGTVSGGFTHDGPKHCWLQVRKGKIPKEPSKGIPSVVH